MARYERRYPNGLCASATPWKPEPSRPSLRGRPSSTVVEGVLMGSGSRASVLRASGGGWGLVSFRRRLASLGFDLGEFVKIVEPWLGRPRPEPRAWPKRVALTKCTHAKVQHAVFAGLWTPVDRSAALGTKREASKLATLGGLDENPQLSVFDFKGAGRYGNNGAERRAGLNLAIRAVACEHHVRVDIGFKGNKATKAFTVYMH
jgi:hypothetical protein